MKKREVYLSLILLSWILFSYQQVEGYTFSRSLTVGTRGQDVIELQKLLNSTPETQISSFGVGSPGQETDYFGSLTREAVIKFQNKYAVEVLSPAGLSFGTGFVGPLTIRKLNTIAISPIKAPQLPTSVPQTVTPPVVTTPASLSGIQIGLSKGEIVIYSVMPREVRPGTNIIIYGRGFPTSGVAVKLGGTYIKNVVHIDESELSVVIPEDFSTGEHTLSFSHPTKQIVTPPNTISVVVSKSPRLAPHISSVSPQRVNESDTVTITGSGFSKNNTIYSLMGEIKNVSSSNNGTTLTFKPSQFSQISQLTKIRQSSGASLSQGVYIPIGVINEGGFTTDKVYLILNK